MWNPFKRFKNGAFWHQKFIHAENEIKGLELKLSVSESEANFYRTQAEAQAKIIKEKDEEIEMLNHIL